MQALLAILVVAATPLPTRSAAVAVSAAPALLVPSAAVQRYMDMQLGMFLHFGLNTFTSQQSGDGNVTRHPPSAFAPTNLSAAQWISTAKALGAKYACLTAQHEGGFSLWNSSYTNYSSALPPPAGFGVDVLHEFVRAAADGGVAPCIYFSVSCDAYHGCPMDELSAAAAASTSGLFAPTCGNRWFTPERSSSVRAANTCRTLATRSEALLRTIAARYAVVAAASCGPSMARARAVVRARTVTGCTLRSSRQQLGQPASSNPGRRSSRRSNHPAAEVGVRRSIPQRHRSSAVKKKT